MSSAESYQTTMAMMRLLCRGETRQTAAAVLGITLSSVGRRLNTLKGRYTVATDMELVYKMVKEGTIE